MSGCCESQPFTGEAVKYKYALWAVITINAIMFFVELSGGLTAQSQALQADALDFAGDSITYVLSLYVIGASLETRALASLFKAASLGAIALYVLGATALRFLSETAPDPQTMGYIGFFALLANVASVLILLRWRNGDSNVRSVWLCSRNDAIGNIGVMAAGFLVAITGSALPDLFVGALLATLFLRSSFSIAKQALTELTAGPSPCGIHGGNA
jgi:cation diffusion facilitator family transporter